MIDYINGNKFADFADFVIYPPEGKDFTPEILSNNAIIFVRPDYLPHVFKVLLYSTKSYILITSASDFPINKNIFSKKPNCIKKWFAINAEYSHPDLIPIPLGVENTITENGCHQGIEGDIDWLGENQDHFLNKTKKSDAIFCSFKVDYHFASHTWTNPHRKHIMRDVKSTDVEYFRPEEKLPYKEYCEISSDYLYSVVPIGNGIDNHRTWELIYMGCIPVVLKNNTYTYDNLPILQLDKWTDLSIKLLMDYSKKKSHESFNDYKETTMIYWKNKIKAEFKKL